MLYEEEFCKWMNETDTVLHQECWKAAIECVRKDLEKKLSDILKCHGERFGHEAQGIQEFLDTMGEEQK